MKKLFIFVTLGIFLLTAAYCVGAYYVIDQRDLVTKVHVGDVYLYSHNWKSANPFNTPIVHKVIVVDIKKVQKRHEYVKFRFYNTDIHYSLPMKQFKENIRRLDYKYRK